MLKISVRNRINEIEKQGSGLIVVRDGPSAKGFAVREANRESRLPNPIAEHQGRIEELSIDKKVEIQPLEGPPEAILARVLHLRCILAGASSRRREHSHTGTTISPTHRVLEATRLEVGMGAILTNTLPLSCDNMAGGTNCQLRYHPQYNITVLTSYQSILHCRDM
ncbi:hypothetical protein E3N88_27613 [Mikania micrantha]|uniref:Uncharacterized protein n=1 Tax=Mikania micrantha TaxID=192012 RepID=A0A5N6N034_9ASTR|nr:hypothetical protein E3N88_27613 [Mikania micrantha]